MKAYTCIVVEAIQMGTLNISFYKEVDKST